MNRDGQLGVKQAAEGKGHTQQKQLLEEESSQWVEVDTSRVKVENCRDFGGPWLGLELVEKLGLKECLEKCISPGREEIPWPVMGLVLVLCRLSNPSS
jgi:hypothetical protein